MINLKDKSKCCGCEACANICPKKCIKMEEDKNGFRYPKVDSSDCIECNLCVKVCPLLQENKVDFNPAIYAVQNKNESIREKSSSGGVFSLLATSILEKDGVVFGVTIDSNLKVKHIKIDNLSDLYKIRGSKYLQSHIGNCYQEVKQNLLDNKLVLFSGTGCQIAGLKNYLDKDYEKLFTIEIVCHGVPSNIAFRQYIDEINKKNDSKVQSLDFRNKKDGWNQYNVRIVLENGKVIDEKAFENDFMKGYIQNFYLRPSCKTCQFKSMSSKSDILLGDFWGVNELGEPWNDDKGSSEVFINTQKGELLFNLIKKEIVIKKVDFEFATRFNPCVFQPVKNYNDIYEDLNVMSFHEAIEKNMPIQNNKGTKNVNLMRRIIRKLRG